MYHFTPREKEIAKLVSVGLWAKEIAGRLGISVRTVETHLRWIRVKTGTQTTAAAGCVLAREGLK